MKSKRIELGWNGEKFTIVSKGKSTVITDETAKEHWDNVGSADWSTGAYNEMARRVMSK